MYTLERAAELLGVSEWTVRRWMKRCVVEGTRMEIDRRVYLSDSDMVTLASYQESKGKANKRKTDGKVDNNVEDKHSQDKVEENFYSVVDAALFLGVSVPTVKKWILKDNVKKEVIITDKKRLYISRDDVFRLADLHKRKVTSRVSVVNIFIELKELREKFKVLAADVEDIKHDLRILAKRAVFIR